MKETWVPLNTLRSFSGGLAEGAHGRQTETRLGIRLLWIIHTEHPRGRARRAPLGMDSESCRGNQDTQEEEPEAELKDTSRCPYDPELTELS